MRILHVSTTSTLSGANRYAFDLAAGQKDLGHFPVVAMPGKPGLAFDFAREDIETARMGEPRSLSFAAIARRVRPDIMHLHDGTVARWARFLPFRPPTMTTLHIRYKPHAMAHLDGVHMLADWQKPHLANFRGAITKVNNWSPALRPIDDSAVANARAAAGAAEDCFLVTFVGRLEHVKGVDLLIEAFQSLPGPGMRLAIVGVGPEEEALRTQAASDRRIIFTGYTTAPGAWYRAADLIVAPSRHEPFALVALEAMAAGAPVVAANVDGFGEIMRDRPGNLVEPNSPSALAAAIASRAAAKTSPGIVRDTHDMARFERKAGVAAVTRFYEEVIAKKRGA